MPWKHSILASLVPSCAPSWLMSLIPLVLSPCSPFFSWWLGHHSEAYRDLACFVNCVCFWLFVLFDAWLLCFTISVCDRMGLLPAFQFPPFSHFLLNGVICSPSLMVSCMPEVLMAGANSWGKYLDLPCNSYFWWPVVIFPVFLDLKLNSGGLKGQGS